MHIELKPVLRGQGSILNASLGAEHAANIIFKHIFQM